MQAGDYVRCNFPFREASGPGPSPHVVFCLATGRIRDERFAIVVYTTSRVAFEGRRRPRQHLLVDASQAVALGQATSTSTLAELPDCRSIRTTFQTCGTARFRRPDVTLHLWKRS